MGGEKERRKEIEQEITKKAKKKKIDSCPLPSQGQALRRNDIRTRGPQAHPTGWKGYNYGYIFETS